MLAALVAATALTSCNPTGIAQLEVGLDTACVRRNDGTVWCWGYDEDGQVGVEPTPSVPIPAVVAGVADVAMVATSPTHTCALSWDRSVRCWGDNAYGQLGDGTTTSSTSPVLVTGLTGAASVTTGSGTTCTVLVDGTVRCWGRNEWGQLGDGSTTDRATPVPVIGLADASSVSAGLHHTCALLADGTARCWGFDGDGQLGDGGSFDVDPNAVPVAVTGLADGRSVSAGADHTCALTEAGDARCWGGNTYGQLGDGTTIDHAVPAPVVFP